MSETPPFRTYTVKELAKIFQKGEETIRRWIKSGYLPARKIGGSYYIEERVLEKLLRGEDPQEDTK